MWSPEENWDELRIRLEDAAADLSNLSIEAEGERWSHLKSKREGVTLALSYMDDFERARGPRA